MNFGQQIKMLFLLIACFITSYQTLAVSECNIVTWKPIVISAHDYYPFGEYMPGRYMADTASHCLTTTVNTIVPSIYYDSVNWIALNASGAVVTHPVGLLGTVTLTNVLGVLLDETTTRNGSGISTSIPYVAAASTHVDVVVSGVIGGVFTFTATDNATGGFLSSTIHSGLGITTVAVPLNPPHSNSVTISITGSTLLPDVIGLIYLVLPHDTTIAQSIVTTVCNRDHYRYGYNGQIKVNELAGLGNHNTAEFWEYDTRTGKRANPDPPPDPSVSSYAAFGNSPIWLSDVRGDTPMIYGQAQALGKTLNDKGGVQDDAAHSFAYKDANIVPALNKNGDLVGYNVYDGRTNRDMPVMQLDAGDLGDFKNNYANYMLGAGLYYISGEPSDGIKKMSAGIATGNAGLYWQGAGEEWSNPANIAQAGLATLGAGVSLFEEGTGYKSFSDFKNDNGSAGAGQAWHHIVEQNPANIEKFGPEAIHNTNNLIKLPNGNGSIHAKVSGYYSSKQPFTNGQTVRKWLNGQSFEQQYDFGIQTLKQFGWKP